MRRLTPRHRPGINSGGRNPRNPQTYRGKKIAGSAFPSDKRPTKSGRKRELMAQARRVGWRGRSYRSAKKFERKLERGGR